MGSGELQSPWFNTRIAASGVRSEFKQVADAQGLDWDCRIAVHADAPARRGAVGFLE